MKNAKQVAFIAIGIAMIVLSVVLIFMKQSNDTTKGVSSKGESGSASFSVPISSLVFEAGACKIDILAGEGNEYFLDYEGLKYGTLTHKLEGETLKISFKQDDNWALKMFSMDDINDQKIILTVPKGEELDRAVFEFGAADVKVDDIVAKELDITVGAGVLNADGVTATELARFKVGAGAFYAEDAALRNATLECGVGEMNLSGSFDGDTSVDCGVGAMELAVRGEQEAYRGELNCGLGEIDFGDISIEASGNKSYGTSSAERRMDIKCGLGEVDVHFYN